MQSQVIQGDCVLELAKLPATSIQSVFMDPPYNIGFNYGDGRAADSRPTAVYLSDIKFVIEQSVRLLKPNGRLWLLGPERWAEQFGAMLTSILPRRNRIIWRETFGQYREDRFPSGHRHLFWHVKCDDTPFYTDEIRVASQRMKNGDRRAKGPRVPDDVWELPRLVGNAAERIGEHPCQLPEALLERVVLCSSKPDDFILDPFAGTGTTLRVSQRFGRRYIGIEKQPKFVALIQKRLSEPIQPGLFD